MVGIGSALAVAAIDPSGAEKIISVVGATGVCAVSYIHPVAVTLRGHQRRWRHPDEDVAAAAAARYYAWHHQGGSSTGARGSGGGRGGGRMAATAAAAEAGAGAGAGPGGSGGLGVPLLRPSAWQPDDSWQPLPSLDGSAQTAADSGGHRDDKPPAAGHGGFGSGAWSRWCALWEGVVEPLLVLAIGVGFSFAALYVAVAALRDQGGLP